MKTRILLVFDDASNGESIVEILRNGEHSVTVNRVENQLATRSQPPSADALVFCFSCFTTHSLGAVGRFARKYPKLPIIIVSDNGGHLDDRLETSKARRLLASVQETLALPKVRRLVRLSGTDGRPAYAALDVRWVSPDLQQRYSVALHPLVHAPAHVTGSHFHSISDPGGSLSN